MTIFSERTGGKMSRIPVYCFNHLDHPDHQCWAGRVAFLSPFLLIYSWSTPSYSWTLPTLQLSWYRASASQEHVSHLGSCASLGMVVSTLTAVRDPCLRPKCVSGDVTPPGSFFKKESQWECNGPHVKFPSLGRVDQLRDHLQASSSSLIVSR